jgi:hypothetical protein
MKKILPILIIIVIFGCNNSQKENRTEKLIANNELTNPVDSVRNEIELTITDSLTTKNENQIYVDLLQQYYEQEDYYLPLYFIKDYSESIVEELKKEQIETVFNGEEEHRVSLKQSAVSMHFRNENIDSLLVFGPNQEIKDTLILQNFEYYENVMESFYTASYKGKYGLKNNVVISKNKGLNLKKSPTFYEDSLHAKRLCTLNNFEPDYIYGSAYAIYGTDTISFLSFADYSKYKESSFILKNGNPTDSIMNDFVISEFTPVPIATDSLIFYVVNANVPETDHFFTSLVSININTMKLEFYDRNRY